MPPSALTRSSSSAGLRTAVLNCDHTDPVHCVQFNPKYVMLVAACWTIWATTWPWTERLVGDKNTYTETINLTTETPEVDRHLLRLWEARHGLIKRWKRQKLNRKLKKRIAAITVEALEYATQLARSNWNKKCTDLQGKLGTKNAWQFLRHLLDPSKSKRNTSQNLQKILRDFPGTNQDLLEQLKLRYSEIRAYHRGQRREYPPPHKTLNREDAVAWRQLQTGAFRNLALLHKFSPTSYKAECPHCGQYASLPHTAWFCTAHPNIPPSHPDPTPENWEAALLSSSDADQLKLIGRARLTADSVGALD
ncbi:hypothetical protein HPB47_004864 [Ixodes persulcatus]|uniref:Uncharacterized protein n=1 Tax=Ixodes persulcatus TaxID=34615 RepID=A0AC60PEN5_IXOPE|nr:hypothetical protein HPB47_004864 [Ixodes persulcatus]